MITLKNVSLQYGTELGLQNISLSLKENTIYGLLGRNGAGKTSLLSILASFRQVSSGAITINNEELFENEKYTPIISFHYPKDQAYETRKLEAIINEAATFYRYFDKDYAYELIQIFKLPLNKKVAKMSKGMQSTVTAIIGLAARSAITIFDEIYVGMDAPTRDTFYRELLTDYETHPRTIILSTHLVSEMAYLFEEIIIIDKGSLLLHGSNEDILNKGFSVIGENTLVDRLTTDFKILNAQRLGSTKSVTVLGQLSPSQRREFQLHGLEVGTVTLQDFFIHLTDDQGEF